MKYTVLGTGLMGAAVAVALVDGGHNVNVWNRTASKAERLSTRGVKVSHDVASAVRDSDAVVLLLLDQDAALDAVGDALPELHGRAVINLMTGTPEQADALAALMAGTGACYLDGAIECYPRDIGRGDALINFSGDEAVWALHADAMRHLAGRSAFVSSDPGAANLLDAALAGTFHNVALGAFVEAVAFLSSRGVDPSAPEVALDYWFDLLKAEARHAVDIVAGGDFTTTEATLSVHLAAVRQWRETALLSGQRASLITAHMHNLEIAEASGSGGLAFASQVATASVRRE